MVTRKAPAKKAAKQAPRHPARRRAPGFDDLTVPGNAEHQGEVTVTLRDGIAALRPSSFDRLDQASRDALSDVMLLVGQRRQLAAEIDVMVRHLKSHGVPWSAIAWVTGMTAEGARTRWSE